MSLEFFITNAFDERADLYPLCRVRDGHLRCRGWCTPGIIYFGTNEPRTFGITFGQKF